MKARGVFVEYHPSRCTSPGKRAYPKMDAERLITLAKGDGKTFRMYFCACLRYHLTSQTKRRAEHFKKHEGTEE